MARTSTSGNRGASRRPSPDCTVEAATGSGAGKDAFVARPTMEEEEIEVVELDDGSGEPGGGSSRGKAADEEIADRGNRCPTPVEFSVWTFAGDRGNFGRLRH